jgi:hypothetical protein
MSFATCAKALVGDLILTGWTYDEAMDGNKEQMSLGKI